MAVSDLPQRGRKGELKGYERKYIFFFLFCFVAFLLLTFRLWQIQIVEGERYHTASTQNIIRTLDVKPARGNIYDRNGVALAENRPSFNVYLEPFIFLRHANDEIYELLASYLNLSESELRRVRQRAEARQGEVLVRRDVSRAEIARLEEDQMRLPGIEVRASAQRNYPLHHVGAHTLGYVAEVGPNELSSLRGYGYRQGDMIGRMGLERTFEAILHGSPGIDRRVVDARGNRVSEAQSRFLIGEYQKIQSVPGRDLVTSLDSDLMVIIDEAVRDFPAAAVVVIDPNDGSVLSLYSKPHFNPNTWSGRLSAMEKMRSDNDPFRPMLDKTINPYFPGSVYKIVGTLAALDGEVFGHHDHVNCPGHYTFGGHRYRCWRDAGHGRMDAIQSLAQSCDVYYYRAAEEMGIDRLATYARMLGFGERTGILVPREQAGRVPDREWYQSNHPEGYTRGADISNSIGQGNTMATPLQVAMAYAAIANGGDLYYPRIVQEIRNAQGEVLFTYEPRVRKRVEMSPEVLAIIRKGLLETVHGERGTAARFRLGHAKVAGKTGTAQVARIGAVRIANEDRQLRQRHHGWFAGYAPYENPEIVVAVFLEHGGGGSYAAAVAMEIIDRYLTRDSPSALSARVGARAYQEYGP